MKRKQIILSGLLMMLFISGCQTLEVVPMDARIFGKWTNYPGEHVYESDIVKTYIFKYPNYCKYESVVDGYYNFKTTEDSLIFKVVDKKIYLYKKSSLWKTDSIYYLTDSRLELGTHKTDRFKKRGS